jgi:hypothetical protein
MIVTVKSKKSKYKRIISIIIVAAMLGAYYYHMQEKFKEQQKQELIAKKIEEEKKEEEVFQKKLERFVYREVEKAVDLLGQDNVFHVEMIQNRVLILCNKDTNIEPLLVRYGSMALIKKTINDIKIAIDIKYIIESKFNEK